MSEKCPICLSLFDEITQLRKNPAEYAETVKKYIDYFDGDILRIPGKSFAMKTREGKHAYEEAVDFLKQQQPLNELLLSQMLNDVAQDIVNDLKTEGFQKLNELKTEDYINKRGSFGGKLLRVLELGGETEEECVVRILASDGDLSRSQRETLLSNDVKRIGMASSRHSKFHCFTVIVACTQMFDKDGKED